jgi:pSer/pThr/pTyr-binding forkhead associated (FHA) protein
LPDDLHEVSRLHCLFDIDPPTVRVRDLGSRNGTFVNGMRIGHPARTGEGLLPTEEPQLELHVGDEVQLGPTILRVEAAGRPEDTPPATRRLSFGPLDGNARR